MAANGTVANDSDWSGISTTTKQATTRRSLHRSHGKCSTTSEHEASNFRPRSHSPTYARASRRKMCKRQPPRGARIHVEPEGQRSRARPPAKEDAEKSQSKEQSS